MFSLISSMNLKDKTINAFFNFNFLVIGLQILFFLIYGLRETMLNIQGDNCKASTKKDILGRKWKCPDTYWISLSSINKSKDIKDPNSFYYFLGAVIILFVVSCIYNLISEIRRTYNKRISYNSPKFFSLLFKNLNRTITKETLSQELTEIYNKKTNKNIPDIVEKVNFVYYTKAYITLKNKHSKLLKDIYLQNKRESKPETINKLKDELKEVQEKLNRIKKQKIENPSQFETSYRSDSVIVSFKTIEFRNQIYKSFYRNAISRGVGIVFCISSFKGVKIENKIVKIEKMIKSQEIIWENLQISDSQKISLRQQANGILKLLLYGYMGFIVVFKVIKYFTFSWFNSSLKNKNAHLAVQIVSSIFYGLFFKVTNAIIFKILEYISKIEIYSRKSTFEWSLRQKNFLFGFINLFSCVFIVNLRIDQFEDNEYDKNNFLFNDMWNRVIENIWSILLVNVISSPIFALLDLPSLFRRIKNKRKYTMLSEEEFEILFPSPQFPVSKFYFKLMFNLMLTLSFAPIFPIFLIIGAISNIMNMICYRYLLVNRYMTLNYTPYNNGRWYVYMLYLSFLFSSFSWLFNYIFYNTDETIFKAFIMLYLIAFFFIAWVLEIILLKVFRPFMDFKIGCIRYDECLNSFDKEYHELNPFTQREFDDEEI